MAIELLNSRAKQIAAYAAFSVFALAVCVYLTFPYDALKDRVQREAEDQGYSVAVGSIGPGLRGVTVHDLGISKKGNPGDKPSEPLRVDSVALRPSLFPPGVALHARALGGTISGSVGGLSDTVVRLSFDDLNLAEGNLKAFSGVDLSGVADGQLNLDIPRSPVPGSKATEPDLSLATGNVNLTIAGVNVNGGTLSIAIPMYGPEPTPIDLPKLAIGNIEGKLKFDKGAGTVETLSAKGQGLELLVTGKLKLAKRLAYAEPNLELRLKTEPEFMKSLGVYGTGLSSVMPADPKDPTWRVAKLSGYLARPSFR